MKPTARSIALDHLAAALPLFPDLPIGAPDTRPLEARDATLARAIDSAVRRRWLTLEGLLAPCLKRPLAEIEPAVRAALLGGAAQILLLDRLPDHAVLNETVEWAKRRIRPGAGGFVNAVLRRLVALRDAATVVERDTEGSAGELPDRRDLPLESGRSLRLPEVWLPDAPAPRLATATSHAQVLVDRWIQARGVEATCRLCRRGLLPAVVVVQGPVKGSPRGERPPELRPHRQSGFMVFEGDDLLGLLQREPGLWVQDPASAAAVAGLAEPGPRLAVDLCAGRGTKTRQLASRWPQAQIVATDVDPARLATLRRAMGDRPGVQAIEAHGVEAVVEKAGGADLVLLDVPCSNTGVLSRRLEARYRFNPQRLRDLVQMQRSIVERGLGLLRRGGRLLYATCSLEPEENEGQWAWIERRPGLRRIAAESLTPQGAPGDDAAVMVDGGGWAVFERA